MPPADALSRQAVPRGLRPRRRRQGLARAAPKVQLVVATMMVPAVMLVVTVMAVELGHQLGPVFGGCDDLTGRRGSAITEYAALVAVVKSLIGALLVMGRTGPAGCHRPGSGPSARSSARRPWYPPRLTPALPRPPRTRRPARPRPRRPVVQLPRWLAVR
ncbi:MAG: hypothetical protein U0237_08975 [Thermoleophilia bacterium]